MDVQYGIAVTNKYDLFLDEDKDPLELIQEIVPATKEDKAAKKKEKKKLKETPVVAVAPVQAKIAPKSTLPEAKPQDAIRKDREDKENKPGLPRGDNKTSPRRGGARPVQGVDDRRTQRERPPRQDRPDAGPPKRSGFVGQYQDDVPPRFAGNDEQRGGFGAGENNRFGDRFGENGPRGRGRGGSRGFGRGRGRGGFGGEDRGGFGGGGGGGFASSGGFPNEENHVDGGNWPQNENESRGGFGQFQSPDDADRGGFGRASEENARGGFGTFGDEEGERASGARPMNREFVRGGRRGGNRPRGGNGNFGISDRGGRQFDRQSGSNRTGVKSTDKRDGSGPHNWGTMRDELAGETEAVNTTLSDETPAEGQTHQTEQHMEPKEGEEVRKSDSEDQHELTLDEWKALQAQKDDHTKPQFNIRRPGDGEDPSLWKKLVPLAKKEKEHDDDEYDEDEDDEDEHHRKKQVLDIKINFIDQSPRGGGRGGRGGMRGMGPGAPVSRGFGTSGGVIRRDRGGGRGGARSGRGRGDTPYRLDEESFPELPSAAPVSA